MGIAADILGLRNDHFSSVAQLLAALEQVYDSPADKISARAFWASAAADLVLTNVAAHAAEALSELPMNRKIRRATSQSLRKKRNSIQRPPLGQCVLPGVLKFVF